VAADSKFYLKTEPALLDRFVAALPSLDAEGVVVTLECVRLHR